MKHHAPSKVILFGRDIKPVDAYYLFESYNISEKDYDKYSKMIEAGNFDDAMDLFIEKYIQPLIKEYETNTMRYANAGFSGEVDKKNSTIMYASIIGLSLAFKDQIKSNISDFFRIVAKKTFSDNNITNPAAKKAILDATLNNFNQLIEGAMSQTQAAILQPIRDAQRLFIMTNQNIAKNSLTGKELTKYVNQFKKDIRRKIPQIETFAEKGLLLSRGNQRFSFNYYFDMATRRTAMNIADTATEYSAEVNQEEILEYKLVDNRPIKTKAREICKSVLANKINGKSYVALTIEAAQKLGIQMLDTVRSKGGLKPNCRHGLIRVPKDIQKELLSA